MAQVLATTDSYVAHFRTHEENLSSDEPGWLRDARRQAFSRFREIGFPTTRRGNEKWKYTNIGPIANADFSYPVDSSPNVGLAQVRSVAPWDDGWASLVFVDGRYAPSLSAPPGESGGVRVANLAEVVRANGDEAEVPLSRYASFEDDAFAALNTAFLKDGAFVKVTAGGELRSPLHLVFVTTGGTEATVSYPRTLIVADAGSTATIIETYVSLAPGGGFSDAVTEIVIGDGAKVQHYKLLLQSEESYHVGISRVYQGQDSTFSSTCFSRGVAVGRNDLRVQLDGPGSSCYLNGLYLTADKQHVDNYINIDHAKPHTKSRLVYRGILDGQSKAVFGGTVLVRPGAVKTDAHQEDKNLLLSADAEVDSKPSLEIYADDVKCGHGATAGTLAEDAIFYMRTRGLDMETASTLLIKGFASAIIDTVQVGPLRKYLEALLSRTLRGVRLGQE